MTHFPYGNGCSDHPDCLTCPFVVCRYDRTPFAQTINRRAKEIELARVIARGITMKNAAAILGVNLRTAQRRRASR